MGIEGVNGGFPSYMNPSNAGGSNATPSYLTPPASECESIKKLTAQMQELKNNCLAPAVCDPNKVESDLIDYANQINQTTSTIDSSQIEFRVNEYSSQVQNNINKANLLAYGIE